MSNHVLAPTTELAHLAQQLAQLAQELEARQAEVEPEAIIQVE